MLVLNVYAVYDLLGESYGQPYFTANDKTAVRMFSDACKDPETPVGRHPQDFALFRIGVWNSDSGSLAGTDVPVPVVTGLALLKGGN